MKAINKTWPEKILRVGRWFLVSLFFLYVIAFIEHSIGVVIFPWAVDYGEIPEVSRAWSLYHNETIYPSWEALPLQVSNYPPVYAYINSVFIGSTGPTPFWGRFISVLATLGSAVVLGLLAYRITKLFSLGLLGGMLYLSGHMVWAWGSLVRVDSLAVFFQVLALLFGYQYFSSKRRHFLWTAMVFCLLAGFTRQTMIATFLAFFCCLLLTDRKTAIQLLLGYTSVGLLGLFFLLWSTDFNAWNHLFVANMNEFGFEMIAIYFQPVWALYHWLIPCVLLGAWKIRQHKIILFYSFFAICSSLLIGKVGSSVNYLLELWFAVCLTSVVSLHHLGRRKLHAELALLVLFIIGWQQIFHVPYKSKQIEKEIVMVDSKGFWMSLGEVQKHISLWKVNPVGSDPLKTYRNYFVSHPSERNFDLMAATEDSLAAIQQPIFSEDMNFTISLGHEVMVQPFEITQMARQKVLKPSPWYECLQNKCFGALVLTFPLHNIPTKGALGWHITPISLQLMREHYRPHKKIGGYWIYLPKQSQ